MRRTVSSGSPYEAPRGCSGAVRMGRPVYQEWLVEFEAECQLEG